MPRTTPVAVIDCAHYEILGYEDGVEIGTCQYCGQVKQYDNGKAIIILRPGDPAKARPRKAEVQASAEQMPTEEKEEVVQEKETVVEVVPPRPQKRKRHWAYFDQNKEAIIADYRSMTLLELYKRWGISTTTWMKLKKEWGVPSKGRGGVHLAEGTGDKRVKLPSTKEVSKAKSTALPKSGAAVKVMELTKQLAGFRVALPDFPPFDKTWSNSVQEAWLNAYCRISELNQRVTSKLPGGER